MNETSIIDRIRQSPRIAKLLATTFDFQLTESGSNDADQWFRLKSGKRFEPVAQDGSGGIFALCEEQGGSERSMLYVSSEGQAGIIANSLSEALKMIIALPYWSDCLHFSGGGNLDDMKRAMSCLEGEIHTDEPNIDSYRQEVLAALELDVPILPLERLYQVVKSTAEEYVVVAEDGSEFDGLFNSFVVSDNPDWNKPLK